MLSNLSGWHFLILLVVVLLFFGAPKLPALAKSIGQSMKILRNEVRNDDEGTNGSSKPADTTPDSDSK
ncbi:MAG TPA: twin-arginine translocase TatA/TatE family subunit [Microbacteriaceae bacterium]|nr:twin-arginine translocase TatA/TatE family subunit [Microbacteriaceae bacterium]